MSSFRDHCIVAAALLACAGCARTAAPLSTVRVAAAADLQFVLPEIVRQFQAVNPKIDVKPVYGSSGNFYSQIRSGAPFDIFLSADVQYPRRLAAEGLAIPETLLPYALGRIVLWIPANSPLDLERLQIHALEDPSVKHVAIANPKHAPYGRAAEAALHSLGVYDRVASRLVLGENIAQTLQFVQSGAADIGVVALSLVVSPNVRGQGRYWEIPTDAYPPIEQAAILLKRAAGSDAAKRFRAFLRDDAARRVLKDYGFGLPEHSAALSAPLWSGSPRSHEAQDGHHALPERR